MDTSLCKEIEVNATAAVVYVSVVAPSSDSPILLTVDKIKFRASILSWLSNTARPTQVAARDDR